MKPSGKPLISMRTALEDPRIFGGILKDKSWDPCVAANFRFHLKASRPHPISLS